ncbi:uncharacterized protein LOC128112700 isoform X1 [Peromyscus californicus insignis]|uniref:uncharacterized protein LOC128112700 isoform X1 n=1 Tax=Peromyscus californicus insignis TaxID=564181 RepID=UPI0022A6B1CC|nr:uncharacterized protein LOC128112700 isoform X1 [Peromyscus californicus insignis]
MVSHKKAWKQQQHHGMVGEQLSGEHLPSMHRESQIGVISDDGGDAAAADEDDDDGGGGDDDYEGDNDDFGLGIEPRTLTHARQVYHGATSLAPFTCYFEMGSLSCETKPRTCYPASANQSGSGGSAAALDLARAGCFGKQPLIEIWSIPGSGFCGTGKRSLLCCFFLGSSLSLLQAALSGASEKRVQAKEVRPTLWNAVEEMRARRATLKTLRLGLLGDTLTDGGLNQLRRTLWELQVVKARGPRSHAPKGARAETVGLPEPQVKGKPPTYSVQGRHFAHLSEAGRREFLGSGLHQKHALRHSEEQARQAPDVALQFSLAQARRQRLREEHQIWIQEELKHLEHQEEVACKHIKGLVAEAREERERPWKEQTVLRLQVEALQAERDMAEHDLVTLYDLYVQATRAQTCHLLQVFQAWQRLWEEKAVATEHHHRSLLAGVLRDSIDLALKTQELQARNQQLEQSAGRASCAGVLPGEEPDQDHHGAAFLCPHS